MKTWSLIITASLLCAGCAQSGKGASATMEPAVKPGIEVLLAEPDQFALIEGKRVGLITNPTGVDSQLRSTIDLLHEHPDVTLAALYGPEHGIRGDAYAGEKVSDVPDPKTHLTYGFATQVAILDEDGALKKMIACHDVGRVINPTQLQGQMYGSLHMGIGYALTEDFEVKDSVIRAEKI